MTRSDSSASPATSGSVRWFTGLTWNGVGLVLAVCLINGLRRTIPNIFDADWVLAPWLIQMLQSFAWGMIIAAPVTPAVVATYNLAPRRPIVRYLAIALTVAVTCFIGVVASTAAESYAACSGSFGNNCYDELGGLWRNIFGNYARYGSLCALFTVVFVYLRAADESAARAQQADLDRARFIQQMDEAHLRMLQAQIEPHFLFNTLANVRRLYQTSPADASKMLDNLMRYFEVALPQMRAADSTLGREAALTESYLEIQRIRMGRRLEFGIDIPDRLRDATLPPMMLLTLAENAIKHGLAPLREGGSLTISAATNGDELHVRVADSGRGFTQSSGGGTGLANIRARLAGMYGAAGQLNLALNTPRGVIATLALPLSLTTPASAT